jgi:putative transcriptional regulator
LISREELEELRDPRYADLAVRLAGELVLSKEPGKLMRYWREKARISQARLAREMGVSPSVLSDYEGGRRKSPGASFIKRFVTTLVKLDHEFGLLLSTRVTPSNIEAILDIGEFREPQPSRRIIDSLGLDVLAGEDQEDKLVYGYTVLDSIKAIYALSGCDFYRIFGMTTERVLVFTKVGLGRSPMVAIRVSQLKPRMVIIHGPEKIDPLAIDLAKRERIILALAKKTTSVDKIITTLRAF